MTEQKLEDLRKVIKEWFDKPRDYTYHSKNVFGTNTHIYFVNSAEFIRDGLYLPLSFTSKVFDIEKPNAVNELQKFLAEFDEQCRNEIDSKLEGFPTGVTNFF